MCDEEFLCLVQSSSPWNPLKKTRLSQYWLGPIKIDWILFVLINANLLCDCEFSRPEFPQFLFPLFLEYEAEYHGLYYNAA